ncbi:MAG: SDR family oxidoreductase [Psychrosphaera sp.]|nr:SDR family oxidoreductase [Psychrosphaera sp.]
MLSADCFKGKVALVTGASRGIGFTIAQKLASLGATVYINGKDPQALDKAVEQLLEAGCDCTPLLFDVSDSQQVKNGFQTLFKQHKRLDILVNNAGVLEDALLGMVSAQQLQNSYQTNVFGPLFCAQYGARLMARNKSGSIINMSSIIGTQGNAGQSVYGGTKAAIIGMTKSLAKELAPNNIRVNAVAPGFIDTDMSRSIGPELYQQRVVSIAMNIVGTSDDVANVVLFLASDLSAYVTGQVIGVDGGMLI